MLYLKKRALLPEALYLGHDTSQDTEKNDIIRQNISPNVCCMAQCIFEIVMIWKHLTKKCRIKNAVQNESNI